MRILTLRIGKQSGSFGASGVSLVGFTSATRLVTVAAIAVQLAIVRTEKRIGGVAYSVFDVAHDTCMQENVAKAGY